MVLKEYANLSPQVIQLAKEQLSEDPKQVSAHLKSFQRWLSTVKHFTCPTDDAFLLRFLRHAKFYQLRARDRIDNYCTFKASSSLGRPDWFAPVDFKSDAYKVFRSSGMHYPLGFLGETGPFVLEVRLRNKPDSLSGDDMWRMSIMVSEWMNCNPRIQVCGIIVIVNMEGATSSQLMAMQNKRDMKDTTRFWHKCEPNRLRQIIYYQEPPTLDAMLMLILPFMSEKMRGRILRCKSDIKKAEERFPGILKLLPVEMGGQNQEAERMREQAFQELEEFFAHEKPAKITVDESKRPSKSELEKFGAMGTATQGVYIKHEQDF